MAPSRPIQGMANSRGSSGCPCRFLMLKNPPFLFSMRRLFSAGFTCQRRGGQKEMRLLKNDFSCGVLRGSDYGGAKEGVHDDGSARPQGAALLLLPPRGSDPRDAPAPADRSLRGFQLRPHPAAEFL